MKSKYRRSGRGERWHAVAECLAATALFSLLAAFCWLCCAGSSYHWE